MSQRPYRIHDDIIDNDPLFSIIMDWDAIEPFILNNDFGIDGFVGGTGTAIMVIDVKLIRDALESKTEHTIKHETVLRKISESTKRDIAVFEIS